ncbi:hypothetical protein B6D29_04320 [Microgenomates bacterium UTCPR1]|nr:MAG: hypothetical protein B6D29_04320 [Microgenomates bacterium UTCPR1]
MKKTFVSFSDFDKIDIRVGEVVEATNVEGSRNIISMIVDLGENYGRVNILSGIAGYYKPEDLIGNKYPFIANLEPKKIMGKDSNGMILVADDPERFFLIPLDKNLKNGTVIR